MQNMVIEKGCFGRFSLTLNDHRSVDMLLTLNEAHADFKSHIYIVLARSC
jgi:hypothetical protein